MNIDTVSFHLNGLLFVLTTWFFKYFVEKFGNYWIFMVQMSYPVLLLNGWMALTLGVSMKFLQSP